MEAFAQARCAGMNQSDAYRSAYKTARMRPKQVHEEASKLSSNPKVAQRIAALAAASADVAVLARGEILTELKRIALFDPSCVIGKGDKILLPNELDRASRAAIASFEIDDMGRIKYKFWPKVEALNAAMKHLGLFEKDNAQLKPPAVMRIELVALKEASDDSKG
jgi:hypothetical protein